MLKVATHYLVIATLLFFKTLIFMSVGVEVCITTNIRLGCHSLQNYSHRMMTIIKDVKMSNLCQPLLEMLVLWGNEQNGPIWTLNGRAAEGRGRRTAPFSSLAVLVNGIPNIVNTNIQISSSSLDWV